jgi:hypothetical protein
VDTHKETMVFILGMEFNYMPQNDTSYETEKEYNKLKSHRFFIGVLGVYRW